MSYRVPHIAIDDLTQLAIYSENCWFGNVIDDELFNLVQEGSAGISGVELYGMEDSHVLRRMYFLFMAEMLKTPWKPSYEKTVVHDYALRAMVEGREKSQRKPVPPHIGMMANAVLNQLHTGDLDRQAVRAVCEWVSIQQKTELCQG